MSETTATPTFFRTTMDRALAWARTRSFWYISAGGGCCADEVLNSSACRYDLERFGALEQVDPSQADLLIISGAVSYKAATHLRALYDEMPFPKYVLAIGSCANSGGAFSPDLSYSTVPGAGLILPVDVYVPGCPPRPEAIMNGMIALQDRINGIGRVAD